jgi:hypothetical protein
MGSIDHIDWSPAPVPGMFAASDQPLTPQGGSMLNLYFHATPNSIKVVASGHDESLEPVPDFNSDVLAGR